MDLLTLSSTPVNPTPDLSLALDLKGLTVSSFTKGQLIEAVVQQVINSVVWLKSDGQLLQARTQVPLQPGQQVLLKVAGVGPQQVKLQLQAQASPPAPSPAGQPGGGIEALLSGWNIPADEMNMSIAQALLTHAQMLDPEDIETIRALGRNWMPQAQMFSGGEGKGGLLEALTYLHTHQLPINDESLSLTRHWLKGLAPLTERMDGLLRSLNDVLAQLSRFEGNPSKLGAFHDSLLSARSQLAQAVIALDSPPEELVARLTQLNIQLSTPPEAELLTSLSHLSSSSSDLPGGVPEKSAGGALPLPSLSSPLERGEKGGVEMGLKANTFARLASMIHETLAQADLDTPTTQAMQRLAEQVELISKDLGAIQLSNLANGPQQAAEPYYLFPIPLMTPEGPRTAQLKVYGQPGQRTINPEHVRLALLLDLPTLGEMVIELTLLQQHLSGRILCGRVQTHRLVESELNGLRDSLSKLGYRVDTLTGDLLAKPEPGPQSFTLNAIDLSA